MNQNLEEKLRAALTPEELQELKNSLVNNQNAGGNNTAQDEHTSARYLRQAQEEKDYPFLGQYRVDMAQYNDVLNLPVPAGVAWAEDNKQAFTVRADAKSLTVDQAIMGSHIFGSNETVDHAGKTLIFLYLDTPEVNRIRVHNSIILSRYPDLKRRAMGNRALKCSLPLYSPLNPKLKEINERILASMDEVQGGEADEKRKPFFTDEKIQGGDYTERVLDANGQQVYAVQMTETDARLNFIANLLQGMANEKQSTKRRTYNNNPQNNNNYNNNNNNGGRGGYNRGGYRGSGGRGNAYGGGAPTEEESKN
ncbi:hypothetical protein, conserved [Angomonas deanei]|uniref:Uncharacterized protein n=1 Tax=Angomonas deanei TaxID=59799 RepID=A0A7G2CAE3_9TRYP|nr:hypothetical protein, conserved [Angomonas deanei]